MNTVKHYLGALRLALIGALSLIFGNPFGASLGAKSGTITAPTGADLNLRTLGDSTPVRETLAGIVRAAFQLASALKIAIINFGIRKAVIVPTATNINTVTGAATYLGQFTLVDPSKKTGPMDFSEAGSAEAGVEALLGDLVAPTPPSFSVESILNRVEETQDGEAAALLGDARLMSVVDQAAGTVKIYHLESAAVSQAAHDAAVALAEDVQFVQTLDTAGGQFGE